MTRPSKRELERKLEELDSDPDAEVVEVAGVTADFVDYGEIVDYEKFSEDVPEGYELSEPVTLGEGPSAATIHVARPTGEVDR